MFTQIEYIILTYLTLILTLQKNIFYDMILTFSFNHITYHILPVFAYTPNEVNLP
jgi:hypothetical protein